MTAIRPGLCSVTFRALTPERIVALAADAGLEVIEWGGDVHVPPGDTARAAEVARATADAGLGSCSYGSYFRAGAGEELTPILDSAEALGVDRVRIWAGAVDVADATDGDWTRTVERLRSATAEAGERGIGLALEFHSGTLAATAPSTLRLLEEVGSPHLTTYWQPTVAASVDTVLDEYRALAAHTSAAHVFSWWPVRERLPLRARDALWTRFFTEAAAAERPPRDALLEFVPGDDPGMLSSEAATLRGYLSA
ncbi:sugar phosphate isomerase/epimerase family protein [Microbacterium hydrocarbonoxydans]|uniref:sugar phosphate isomerase/epimerase family protein n=1 Tax=Microbacterium hydrocarbonoxydans TaxID=273678 RepID=UPI0007BBA051|nr:sugar phosphate isomerase/epimerase [Microbacterium hydrocarbonoxydans]GAT74180.1 sugar phosphate isomerase/epimerase [Microbacterium sp. HM58-2]